MEIPAETKEFKTQSGEHVVIAKAYLTGYDKRAYRKVLIDLQTSGKGGTAEGLDEADDVTIKTIVISVDGDTNVLDKVLGMRSDDYEEVMDYIKLILNGDDKKKVISDTSTKTSSQENQDD